MEAYTVNLKFSGMAINLIIFSLQNIKMANFQTDFSEVSKKKFKKFIDCCKNEENMVLTLDSEMSINCNEDQISFTFETPNESSEYDETEVSNESFTLITNNSLIIAFEEIYIKLYSENLIH